MNVYVLSVVGKWLGVAFVSLLSLFGAKRLSSTNMMVTNSNSNRTLSVVNEVLKYNTVYEYDEKVPVNVSRVKTAGVDGILYRLKSGEVKTLRNSVDELVVKGTGPVGEYSGIITAYGPDCKTCSGEGFVACRTRERTNFNLINDGIYYNDVEFGEVRVLAAALSVFPCGTIVYVENSILKPFYGIVMDTGYGMVKSLSNDKIHFDVAFKSEKDEDVLKVTNMHGNVKYTVQRWGY